MNDFGVNLIYEVRFLCHELVSFHFVLSASLEKIKYRFSQRHFYTIYFETFNQDLNM